MRKILSILYINLVGLVSLSAQYQKPPNVTIKTINYELPELIIQDTVFINQFDSLIFNSSPNVIRACKDKYLRISIQKNDEIYVELSDICGDASTTGIGYFERNDLTYIVTKGNISNVFAVTDHKKCFIYNATMWGDVDITEDDLPLWILRYNCQTGNLEIKEKPCS